jgi:hypothetical protein
MREVVLDDLVAELVQNELDARSSHTMISFGADDLICEGTGQPINDKGWGAWSAYLVPVGK